MMTLKTCVMTLVFVTGATAALSHGDVAPQPVNTEMLPEVGEDWLTENPYRDLGDQVWQDAITIGASGYNQNCARCHGLEAISGGLAPDLRFLEAEEYGDEWYIERFRYGYTQNGITKMPEFGDLLGQKAAWAIRTYIEARPDDGMMSDATPELKLLRDKMAGLASSGEAADATGIKAELEKIAAAIETLSGAPVADSAAFRAAALVDGTSEGYRKAAEALTIGLSAAN